MRKYLKVTVVMDSGYEFINELKLSEAHLISPMAKVNKKLIVECVKCDKETYNLIFN